MRSRGASPFAIKVLQEVILPNLRNDVLLVKHFIPEWLRSTISATTWHQIKELSLEALH